MAKYGKAAGRSVKRAVHKFKRGEQHSGPGGKRKAKSRKQAIAIGLSKARKKGSQGAQETQEEKQEVASRP